MNSRWNDNLIIFAMEVVSTHFDDWVKIRVFRPHRESTPCQTWSKLPKIFMELGFDIKLWKMLFCENFNLVCPLVNLRLTRGILVILAEKGTLGAPMSEWVVPHHFGCPHGPMERKFYFWIFRVRHANRGQTKYIINTALILASSYLASAYFGLVQPISIACYTFSSKDCKKTLMRTFQYT